MFFFEVGWFSWRFAFVVFPLITFCLMFVWFCLLLFSFCSGLVGFEPKRPRLVRPKRTLLKSKAKAKNSKAARLFSRRIEIERMQLLPRIP